MYHEREQLHQTISMCSQLFAKNQMTTVVLLLEPALPSENLRLLELLAKAYFSLGFYRSCRQVSLLACTALKAGAEYPEMALDLAAYLHLIILSEIELNLEVAKEHEEELRKQLTDGKELDRLLKSIAEARFNKQHEKQLDLEAVRQNFQRLTEKCRTDEYLRLNGVPAYLVSTAWMKKFEEGVAEPINSLNLLQRSPYMDLDKNYLHMNYLVREGLQEQSDYVIMGKEPWSYLQSVFGGTEIRRMVVGDTVEVNYRLLKVLFVSPMRMRLLEVPVSRSEICQNIRNHLKRVLVWHKLIDNESMVREQRLLVVKDMHNPSLLMKQIAANKLAKHTNVVELNDMSDFEEFELGLREFLVYEFTDKDAPSIFGKNVTKQKIECSERCLTCLKKEAGVVLCECKTVSFCSQKCRQLNAKHAEVCRKIVQERNPLGSLLQTYNISKDVRVPKDFNAYGKTGLENIGNTCFMNAALQCIANLEDLTMFFLKNEHLADINLKNPLGSEGKLACAYGEFLKELFFTTRRTIEPRTLKKIIERKNNQFTGYAQQDSQEFLSYFLDLLHEDLNRVKTKPCVENIESDGRPDDVISRISLENYQKRNLSVVSESMVGQYKSELHCPDCDRISITFDPFMTVTLPLPNDKDPASELIGYPILMDGTIGKVTMKVPTNRLISYMYERLGRKFSCAYISDKKIKQRIEGDDAVVDVAKSSSSLFMYEVEEGANLEVELAIQDEAKNNLTFARRVLTKDIDSLDKLKRVIYLRLKRPIGELLGNYTSSDEDYLTTCF